MARPEPPGEASGGFSGGDSRQNKQQMRGRKRSPLPAASLLLQAAWHRGACGFACSSRRPLPIPRLPGAECSAEQPEA